MQLTWFGSRQTYSTPPSLLTTARDLHLGSYPCVVQVTPIKLEDVVDLRTEPYHPQCIRQLAAKCKAQRCYESQSRQLKMKVKKIISMLHAVKSPLHTSIHCLHHWPYQSKIVAYNPALLHWQHPPVLLLPPTPKHKRDDHSELQDAEECFHPMNGWKKTYLHLVWDVQVLMG